MTGVEQATVMIALASLCVLFPFKCLEVEALMYVCMQGPPYTIPIVLICKAIHN